MNKLKKRDFFIYLILIILLSALILVMSFYFTGKVFDFDLFKNYFKYSRLVLLNYMPIFILFLLVWIISNRLWLGFSITSLLVLIGGIANRSKLTYRDDPLEMFDFKLIGEAGMMAEQYKLPINTSMLIMITFCLIVGFILYRYFNERMSGKTRLSMGLVIIFLSFFSFKNIYLSEEIYANIGHPEPANRWIESHRIQVRGSLYPFIHSSKELFKKAPEGYDPKIAEDSLREYEYKDIDPNKKVHIIAVMLEAYNDFSKFDNLGIDSDVYKNFHQLKEEGIGGELVTDIFAGGTIATERSFLTGYMDHPEYKENTNSFVWYLNEQGYRTEAMHPITGSFYNRRNINELLGFQNFDYLENKYEEVTNKDLGYLTDEEFFPYIYQGYKESVKESRPYFNLTVTYQNHGPYSDERYYDNLFQAKEEYDQGLYNIFNNYLYGIKETDKALKEFVDGFRQEDEPVVLVFFGDHNPWLGEGNSVYEMLGIDLDIGKEEGFKNYYSTPYLIWGNEKAKDLLGKDLNHPGEDISSKYLMVKLFEELGYEGNEYMQYSRDLYRQIPVQNKNYYKEEGIYTKEVSDQFKEKLNKDRYIQYYMYKNFKSDVKTRDN